MGSLRQAFSAAVSRTMDNRGKPGLLGRVDGTLYWTDAGGAKQRDRVWVRVGESGSRQEVVAYCYNVTPQYDMPVRVDNVNGVLTIISLDSRRALEFSGHRPGFNVPAHAWLHGRFGPDPVYVEGLQFLPFLVHPTAAASLAVTVEGGAYRWGGALKVFETADSSTLAAYVPGSSLVGHFVIVCLNRATNGIVIADGDDVPITGGDALFAATTTVTAAAVMAVTLDPDYLPLAAVLLSYGQTAVRTSDIVMDLRLWGMESVPAVGEIVRNAGALWPSTTGGCAAAALVEYGSNGVNVYTLDFDATTQEYAEFTAWMPDDWDGGTVTFEVVWTAASGSGDVIWALQGRAYANGDAIDQAWGTAVVLAADTLTAVGDAHYTGQSGAVTLAGAPAAGQLAQFRIYRDADDAGDTLGADAQLLAVRLRYSKGA